MLGSSQFESDLDGVGSPNDRSDGSNFETQQPNSVNSNSNLNENEIRSYAGKAI